MDLIHRRLHFRSTAQWWEVAGVTCVAAYKSVGAANLASSLINLVDSGTHPLTYTVAPSFAVSTGWGFNSTPYLKTDIAVSGSNYSCILSFKTQGRGAFFGALGSVSGFYAFINPPTGVLYARYGNSHSNIGVVSDGTSGTVCITGTKLYYLGVDKNLTLANNANTTGYPIFIGAYNNLGTAASQFNGYITAVAIYSGVLTAAQVSTLNTAMVSF